MTWKRVSLVNVAPYILPLSLRVSAIALVLVAAAWFIGTYVDISPSREYGANPLHVQPLWLRSQVFYERVFQGEQCGDRCAQIRIHFHEADLVKQQANWTVQLVIPDGLKRRLAVGFDYVAEPDPDMPDQLILKEQYRTKDLPLTLAVHSEFPTEGNDAEFQIPLSEIFSPGRDGEMPAISVPLQPLLYGRPRLFPSDWYSAVLGFTVALPTGLVAWNENMAGFGEDLLVELWVASDIGMNGKEMFLESDGPDNPYASLHFLIIRDRTSRAYVYMMGCLPLLLAVVFGHMMLINKRTRSELMHVFMLDAVAGMLAVLPLRAILVPAEIPDLLRIDFLLGMALAAFAAIVLWRYSQEIWPAEGLSAPTAMKPEQQPPTDEVG